MTDSQKSDGTHGTCPDMDNILKSMGMDQFEKVMSPASPRQAKRGDHSVTINKKPSDNEYSAGESDHTRNAAGK